MPQTEFSGWLQFALQQMAAESYLGGFNFSDDTTQLIDRLKFGNNNSTVLGLTDPNAPTLSGMTRFTTVQAQQFTERYHIVDHHANDATGFSATLMFDNQTQSYTLSFRSTEYLNQVDGGDYERDGLPGADGEIKDYGFAFGQLAAMEEYVARLKQGILSNGSVDASLQTFFADPAHQLNVTGYSLGGHLATVFTELHADRMAA